MTTILQPQAAKKETLVGMGQVATVKTPGRLKAVLGSCIGLVLYHPRLKIAAMAHIVLPDSAGRSGAPGKFADTALPEIFRQLKEQGVPKHGLVAKFAGAANMFNSSGPLQIGDANTKAVSESLRHSGVRVLGHDVGGNKGRRVIFDAESGTMTIERAAEATRTL